jgi:transmembrane sensor
MDQAAYTVEGLLTDESFLAYVLGTDPAAVWLWEDRLRRHPGQAPVIEEAASLIRLMAIRPAPLAQADLDVEVRKLEARLAGGRLRPVSAARPQASLWMRVAASLLLLLLPALLAWLLLFKPDPMLTYRTQAGESAVVVLPDSSAVFLSGNSTLRYPKDWQGRASRQVWLQGEAFFHVQPKPVAGGLKFLVHTGQASVEVLGTRFNVWNRNQNTRVVLNSGKVKVNVGKGRQPVVMAPGEMVELWRGSARPRKTKVALAAHPAQKESKVVFQDASIRRIVLVVKEYYGLQVRLQDSSIAELRISGTLPTNNEKSFLKALAIILDLEITKGKNKEVIFKRNP